jgi:hypothetical protein
VKKFTRFEQGVNGPCEFSQGNRIKKEEVRAKPAKGSERGFIQPVDPPLNLFFEQIFSEMDEPSVF